MVMPVRPFTHVCEDSGRSRTVIPSSDVRIPRHLDTQPTIIWTLVPRSLGHLIHVHLARQSERSDAGLHC